MALSNDEIVEQVLDDWRTAPIDEKLRAMLGFLEKLTLHPTEIDRGDADRLRAVGLTDAAIEEAIHVCAAFNIIDRIADALDFEVPPPDAAKVGGAILLERGYAPR